MRRLIKRLSWQLLSVYIGPSSIGDSADSYLQYLTSGLVARIKRAHPEIVPPLRHGFGDQRRAFEVRN